MSGEEFERRRDPGKAVGGGAAELAERAKPLDARRPGSYLGTLEEARSEIPRERLSGDGLLDVPETGGAPKNFHQHLPLSRYMDRRKMHIVTSLNFPPPLVTVEG